MKPHVSVITLGVRDLNRAKEFYSDGLAGRSTRSRMTGFASASLAHPRSRSTRGTRLPTTPA
jgi:catechol 2,3-dioxygenase-like lactoylglutathione lyase family enzyme